MLKCKHTLLYKYKRSICSQIIHCLFKFYWWHTVTVFLKICFLSVHLFPKLHRFKWWECNTLHICMWSTRRIILLWYIHIPWYCASFKHLVVPYLCVFAQSISRDLKKMMNFCFLKRANIPVYGNIAVYIKYCYCLSKNKLFTKMLRVHLFSIFTIKTPRLSLWSRP